MSVEVVDRRDGGRAVESLRASGLRVQSIANLETVQGSGYESSGLVSRSSNGKPGLNQTASQGRLTPVHKLSWIASNVRTLKEEREQKTQTATKLLEGRYEVAGTGSSRKDKLGLNK